MEVIGKNSVYLSVTNQTIQEYRDGSLVKSSSVDSFVREGAIKVRDFFVDKGFFLSFMGINQILYAIKGEPLKVGQDGVIEDEKDEAFIRGLKKVLHICAGAFLILISLPIVTVSTLAALLLHTPVARVTAPDEAGTNSSAELSIMSWNVQGGSILSAANRFSSPVSRASKIAEEILAQDPDVINIQEAFDGAFQDELIEKLKNQYPFIIHHVGLGRSPFKLGSGLFSASKLPVDCSSVQFKRFTSHSGDDNGANKGLLTFSLMLPARKVINIGNTHLQAGADDDEKAQIIVKQVQSIEDEIGKQESTILTGDFNISPIFATREGVEKEISAWDSNENKFLRGNDLYAPEMKDEGTFIGNDGGVCVKSRIDHVVSKTNALVAKADNFMIGPVNRGFSDHRWIRATVAL